MQLVLKYNQFANRPARAVFINGNSPSVWLREISGLGTPAHQLECYVVPTSIKTIEPGGLLVIMPKETLGLPPHLPTYALLAGKLCLPVQAELQPPVTEDELQKILLWEVQLFHPTIGLVGFERKDRINLASLLKVNAPVDANWGFANPGQPPLPPLHRLSVEQPEEDILKEFLKEVDQKPLKDIPKKETKIPPIVNKVGRAAGIAALGAASGLAKLISSIMPKGGNAGSGSTPARPVNHTQSSDSSWLDKLSSWLNIDKVQNWIEKSLEQLQKERDEEIMRLMKMFEEDSWEALKYAIPLSSNYEDRGTAEPGSKLSERNPLFDLFSLGGGRPGDGWDIGNHYTELRNKYLRAAQKEIEQKNFKRAAYIYAHLLGDFSAAANVLVQGKMYREAAALYKDHLKNIPAAANCLEEGGLLNDAIDLYIELGKDEKVADLYTELGQGENAGKYYLRAADKHYSTRDYLETARVYRHKMNNLEKASAVWLLGWKEGVQQEACLQNYFGLINELAPDNLPETIDGVYKNTPPQMQTPLLNVLLQMNKTGSTEDVKALSTSIAYEVVSEQIGMGNLQNINMLSNFVEQDKMLSSDVSRFVYGQRKNVQLGGAVEGFSLMKNVEWMRASGDSNGFVAIGFSKERLVFARANWYGNVDYAIWSETIVNHFIHLILRPYPINRVMLYFDGGNSLSAKTLPQNKYFNQALSIDAPVWLPKDAFGICFNQYGKVAAMYYLNGAQVIGEYTMDGKLQKTISCLYQNEDIVTTISPTYGKMAYRNNYYFISIAGHFLAISDQGTVDMQHFGAPVTRFEINEQSNATEFLIATEEDIYHVVFNEEAFLVKRESAMQRLNTCMIISKWSLPTPDRLVGIKFLSGNHFAVASEKQLQIFSREKESASLVTKVKTTDRIVAVLNTNDRNTVAVLLGTGKVETFKF